MTTFRRAMVPMRGVHATHRHQRATETWSLGTRAVLGEAGELGDRERLAAQPGVDARPPGAPSRRRRRSRPSRPARRAASCGAGRTRRRSTANTSSRSAVVAGGSRRTRRTSPESTFGAGQNTRRPIDPARVASAYQATLTDGVPYVREPGGATSRSATSACTMTRPRCSDGSVASRCRTTGTATLYGRFATSAVGAGPGRSAAASVSASAVTTSSRSTMIRCPLGDGRRQPGGQARVDLDRDHAGRDLEQPERERAETRARPRARRQPGSSAAARTIRRTVFGSITKFWPSCFAGRKSSSAASRRTSAGPRSLGPADVSVGWFGDRRPSRSGRACGRRPATGGSRRRRGAARRS